MDLRESNQSNANRHPWELARATALRDIVETCITPRPRSILDIGCGDGYLIDALFSAGECVINAIDVHMTEMQRNEIAKIRPRVLFHNSYQTLGGSKHDLITMFDVLEHIEDDAAFLRETIHRFAEPGGGIFLTVPAFQFLFSSHDLFLKHCRRYSQARLLAVLGQLGVQVTASGYLFGGLLPVRTAAVLLERLFGASGSSGHGVGRWRQGAIITNIIKGVLDADNCFLTRLSRMGITLPGLTVWALCKIPR